MMYSHLAQYFFCSLLLASFSFTVKAEMLHTHGLEGVEIIDTETLIAMAQSDDQLILVDSRLRGDLAMGYIGGAKNLSHDDTNCTTLSRITADRNRSLVFYCNGVICDQSHSALKIAQQCGYRQLYWLQGGFEEWRNKDYPYLLE